MVQAADDIDKLCKFYKNMTTMQTVLHKQEMQIFHIKMATFPLLIVCFFFFFFFKINRVVAID